MINLEQRFGLVFVNGRRDGFEHVERKKVELKGNRETMWII